ncbi:hypothetical protein [Pseudomonas sp. RIT-PI-AD]|uniref:hypothetical protein n=1 Tax=Pseudomonas sp. RIT-PI-AD TaxID=3035294 RepID=UPI0021DAD495|nr:hypothetical protein [Pseudomonas sp. RIT-PI-AD]
MTYLAFKELDRAEYYLRNSNLVKANKRYLGGGRLARVMRMLQISSCLSTRNFSIRKGQLDAGDVSEFPEELARQIVWTGRVILVFVILMLISSGCYNHLENKGWVI